MCIEATMKGLIDDRKSSAQITIKNETPMDENGASKIEPVKQDNGSTISEAADNMPDIMDRGPHSVEHGAMTEVNSPKPIPSSSIQI